MKLKHVAIIPDGNRRWAKKNKLASFIGHERGVNAFENILNKAIDLKIPYFSFWGASLDNITKRSKTEVHHLFKIFEREFERLYNDERIMEYGVRVDVIGRWKEYFPQEVIKNIEKCITKTKRNKKMTLTFLLAYNGDDEMIACINKIKKSKITEQDIKKSLWTKDLPPVDLIIRTGIENDPHNSAGFMMWDTRYSQLAFSPTLFPDFTKKDFGKIIKDFEKRQLRKGK